MIRERAAAPSTIPLKRGRPSVYIKKKKIQAGGGGGGDANNNDNTYAYRGTSVVARRRAHGRTEHTVTVGVPVQYCCVGVQRGEARGDVRWLPPQNGTTTPYAHARYQTRRV